MCSYNKIPETWKFFSFLVLFCFVLHLGWGHGVVNIHTLMWRWVRSKGRLGLLTPSRLWGQQTCVRLSGKCLYLPSHLTGLTLTLKFINYKRIISPSWGLEVQERGTGLETEFSSKMPCLGTTVLDPALPPDWPQLPAQHPSLYCNALSPHSSAMGT